MLLLFSGMVLKAWQNYTIKVRTIGGREKLSEESGFASSENEIDNYNSGESDDDDESHYFSSDSDNNHYS